MSFMGEEKRAHLGSRRFTVKAENARLHSHFHLYSVVGARARGVEGWERGRIAARPTIIYDLSGLPLFYDFPVRRGRKYAGFIRTAANKALGDSVIGTQLTSPGWDMEVARNELRKLMEKKYGGYAARRIRLVCYSYPELALSADLVSPGRETKTLLMDVGDFTEIPPKPVVEIDSSGQVPYSLLDKVPEEREKAGPRIWDELNQGGFKVKRLMISVSILIITVLALSACAARTPEVVETAVTATPEPMDTSKFGGTLIVQTPYLIQFDPIFVTGDPEFHVVSNVFSTLLHHTGTAEGETFPDLATSWEYEDDTTVILRLRQGVVWHDDNVVFPKGASREVVADDVVYSIRRAVETEGSTVSAYLLSNFESVEAVDAYTVRLSLKHPDGLLLRHIADAAVVPHEGIEKLGENFAMNPIGSGPFKFVEYKPDESLTLVRNDLYWKKPYLEKIIYRVIPDEDAAVIALENGEIDVLGTVPQAELERIESDDRFTVYPDSCPVAAQITFNLANPLFSEKFRQAVAYALDGDAINANAYGGMHVSGCGTAGPGVPGYDPDLCSKYFPYDPEEAQAILLELGWEDTDGDGILDEDGQPLEFPLVVQNTTPEPQLAAAIATQLREIGIRVELQTVEAGAFAAEWFGGAEKAFLVKGFCGDGGMNIFWGRDGFVPLQNYDDPEIFDLLERASTMIDQIKRDQTLREAANKIYGQYWAIPLGFHVRFAASSSAVHDYEFPRWWQNLCTEHNNVWVEK